MNEEPEGVSGQQTIRGARTRVEAHGIAHFLGAGPLQRPARAAREERFLWIFADHARAAGVTG